jgi:hypothetical protein
MVRIKASILILALMVAPLASLCGTASGTAKQCPPLCPMMHGGTHATAEQTDDADGMECHHGKSTKEDCGMEAGCGHTLDLGLASPLPPVVVGHVMKLIAPGTIGTIRLAGAVPSLAGFKTPPLQPPRT